MIEIKDLCKKYGTFLAIDHINLKIEKGDFYGFIGPNGAGKTTTMKTMLDIIHKSCGEVKIFGKDHLEHQFEEAIGYLPGEASLYENLTAKEQIDYFKAFYSSIDEVYLHDLISYFDVDLYKKIKFLSLGNKKKVALVCALMHQPKLIILDEVTNGLDPLMQQKVFMKLMQLNKEGVTIFLSSHNLNDISKYCNKIAVIREGKIVLDDRKEHIISEDYVVTVKAKKLSSWLKEHQFTAKKLENDTYRFLYHDNINSLLHLLQEITIDKLEITDMKLEDLFEELYRK